MFVRRTRSGPKPAILSASNDDSSARLRQSNGGFGRAQLGKSLDHGEAVKQDQVEPELQCCTRGGGGSPGISWEYSYSCTGEGHIPRYMANTSHKVCKNLKSYSSSHSGEESLLPSNYTFTSLSPTRSSGPKSLPRSGNPMTHGSGTVLGPITNTSTIVLPQTPSDNRMSVSKNEAFHKTAQNLPGPPTAKEKIGVAARLPIRSGQLYAKGAKEVRGKKERDETDPKAPFVAGPDPSRPILAENTESSHDSLVSDLISDTESDNEGDWLTGSYIPGFLLEQWLSGSALEMPTMEARALAIVRQALADQVMAAFPDFDRGWAADFTSNTGSSSNPTSSTSDSKLLRNSGSNSSSSNHGRKRSCDNEEDSPADGGDRLPDASGPNSAVTHDPQLGLKLACPFRKHDAEKYNLHEFRVCATTPWSDISRLKEHLRRAHKAPPYCRKCKQVFKTLKALYSHIDASDKDSLRTCTHRDEPEPAGMTPLMEESLKSRWKASTPQERWAKIYHILFPNEGIPLPDFEEVLDISSRPRPSTKEFRRLFRARVNSTLDTEIMSLSEGIKSKLADILEDCYAEFDRARPSNQETTPDTSLTKSWHQLAFENNASPSETYPYINWDTAETPDLQGEAELIKQEIGKKTPLGMLGPFVSPNLELPSTNIVPSNCFCLSLDQCTHGFNPPAGASRPPEEQPDMEFEDSGLYMSEYEALWSDGRPTDMDLFNSLVNED